MSKFEIVNGRPVVTSDIDRMTMDEIREHLRTGHLEAVAILRFCEQSERKLARTLRERDHARRERRRRIAAENQAARERSKGMLAEMAAMRQATERAEGRAIAAEGGEREALDLARRNYRAAVVAAIVAVLSLAATLLVAVLA